MSIQNRPRLPEMAPTNQVRGSLQGHVTGMCLLMIIVESNLETSGCSFALRFGGRAYRLYSFTTCSAQRSFLQGLS